MHSINLKFEYGDLYLFNFKIFQDNRYDKLNKNTLWYKIK